MTYLQCTNCKASKAVYPKPGELVILEQCPWCKSTTELFTDMPLPTIPTQLPLGFKVPGPKTLKPEADSSKPLGSLVENAQAWLNAQDQYTKMEFKYGRNYIVIAKLKD